MRGWALALAALPPGVAGTITHSTAPYCGEVWDPMHPPASASQEVIGAVRMMENAGYWQQTIGMSLNVPTPSGGTMLMVPFEVYMLAVIATNFNAHNPSPSEQLCLAVFDVAQRADQSQFKAMFQQDLIDFGFTDFQSYIMSDKWQTHRMCDCYAQIKREQTEFMNCRATPSSIWTISANYFFCNEDSWSGVARNDANVANWEGCFIPSWVGTGPVRNGIMARHGIVPQFWLPGPATPDWLDRTKSNCIKCATPSDFASLSSTFDLPAAVISRHCRPTPDECGITTPLAGDEQFCKHEGATCWFYTDRVKCGEWCSARGRDCIGSVDDAPRGTACGYKTGPMGGCTKRLRNQHCVCSAELATTPPPTSSTPSPTSSTPQTPSPTSSTPAPSASVHGPMKPIPGTVEYVGCFLDGDDSNRQLDVRRGRRGLHVVHCSEMCSQYQYFAVQDQTPNPNGQTGVCFCSNGPDVSGTGFRKLDDSECHKSRCTSGGDRTNNRYCGGPSINAVYKRFHLPNAVDAYVGCFKDDASNRQFTTTVTGRNGAKGNFVGQCGQRCTGYKYFAVQGSEPRRCTSNPCGPAEEEGARATCFCGNDPDLSGNNGYARLEDGDMGPDGSCPSSQCFSKLDRAPSDDPTESPNGGNRPCGPSNTNAVYRRTQADVAGDPFTTYNGKRVQFYLPVGQDTKLLTCGSFELDGRVMASGVEGDAQQWFDKFVVRMAGRDVVAVDMRDAAPLLPISDDATAGAADDADDVTVPSAAGRVQLALLQARRAAAAGAAAGLTTLRVAVGGDAVQTTGTYAMTTTRVWNGQRSSRTVNVTVTQDTARLIGRGFVETIDVVSDDIGVQIQSSLATKFESEADRIKKMHMDLSFTSINATACAGVLPEVWGVKPVSQQTARFLEPQQ